ncbi:hypothetical protein FXO38_05921 [Capsicum annuum]|nr:hypothetical protein FXO38_05921 [Capsicum annuum]KAF3675356.1 hypothetical protein FXO37_05904 [Capsicum annuum]
MGSNLNGLLGSLSVFLKRDKRRGQWSDLVLGRRLGHTHQHCPTHSSKAADEQDKTIPSSSKTHSTVEEWQTVSFPKKKTIAKPSTNVVKEPAKGDQTQVKFYDVTSDKFLRSNSFTATANNSDLGTTEMNHAKLHQNSKKDFKNKQKKRKKKVIVGQQGPPPPGTSGNSDLSKVSHGIGLAGALNSNYSPLINSSSAPLMLENPNGVRYPIPLGENPMNASVSAYSGRSNTIATRDNHHPRTVDMTNTVMSINFSSNSTGLLNPQIPIKGHIFAPLTNNRNSSSKQQPTVSEGDSLLYNCTTSSQPATNVMGRTSVSG